MKIRLLSLFLLAALLLSFLPVYAEPEETGEGNDPGTAEPSAPFSGVLTGVDAELCEGLTDLPIDFFTQPTVGWTSSVPSVRLTAERVLPFAPARVFGGKYALLLTTDTYSTVLGLPVSRAFGEAEGLARLDASKSDYFVFSVCVPAKKGADWRVSVRFVSYMISPSEPSGPITYERSFSLSGGGWETVLCDVSGFDGRGDIRSVTLTVTDASASYGDTVSAAINSVGFTSCPEPVRALRFLTDSFLAQGCEAAYGDELTVSLTDTEATLKTPAPFSLTPSADTVLCVKLRAFSGIRTLSLTVTPADPASPSSTVSAELSASSGVTYCYFPLGTVPLSALTLTFAGSVRGEAHILSLTPLSYPVVTGGSGASITSCLLSASGQSYEVEGTLSEDVLRRYEGASLLLFSLPLGEEGYTLSTRTPAAQTDLSRQFRFTCAPEDGVLSVLSRKLVVAVSYRGTVTALTGEFCITNPEAVAVCASVPAGLDGKKGACPIDAFTDTDRVSDTAAVVALDSLFSAEDAGIPFVTDGVTYYYDEAVLARLDRVQSLCRLRGTRALLVLTLTPDGDGAARYGLRPSGIPEETEAKGLAFNTENGYAVSALRAAAELLSSRYLTESDGVGGFVGFVVGENVNETAERYYMGSVPLASLVRSYAAALRTVWATARSVNAAAKVYVSLSSRFGGTETRAAEDAYGARIFLDALNEVIVSQGNFPWQVAFDPYPTEEYLAYADTGAQSSPEAPFVTAANLEVLTSYISRRAFYYLGQYRPVTLYEPEKDRVLTDQNHLIRQAADYVFTCCKIGTKNYSLIETVIPSPGHPISYEDSLRLLDSDPTGEGIGFALEVIGIPDWGTRITGFDLARTVTGSILAVSPLGFRPSSVIGEMTLIGFEKRGDTADFEALPETASLIGGTTIGSTSYLSLTAPEGEGGDWFGSAKRFVSPLDLTVSPYLSFTLIPTSLSGDASEMDCRIVLSSREDLAVAETVVRAGEPNEVLLDLRTFAGLKTVDSIRLYFRGRNGEDVGTPTVLVGGVRVLSGEYRSTELREAFDRAQNAPEEGPGTEARRADPRLILLLVSVMVIAMTVLALRLMNATRQDGGGKARKIGKNP